MSMSTDMELQEAQALIERHEEIRLGQATIIRQQRSELEEAQATIKTLRAMLPIRELGSNGSSKPCQRFKVTGTGKWYNLEIERRAGMVLDNQPETSDYIEALREVNNIDSMGIAFITRDQLELNLLDVRKMYVEKLEKIDKVWDARESHAG